MTVIEIVAILKGKGIKPDRLMQSYLNFKNYREKLDKCDVCKDDREHIQVIAAGMYTAMDEISGYLRCVVDLGIIRSSDYLDALYNMRGIVR